MSTTPQSPADEQSVFSALSNLFDSRDQAIAALQTQLRSANNEVSSLQSIMQQQAAAAAAKWSAAMSDVLAGRLKPIIFAGLQRLPFGTSEKLGQWSDAGGAKADSNPASTVRAHGIATIKNIGAFARMDFQPAAPANADQAKHNDNAFLFVPLDMSQLTALPRYWISGRTIQLTAADQAGNLATESDSQITWSGETFNGGFQFLSSPKEFRIFQYVAGGGGHWIQAPAITAADYPDFSQPVQVLIEREIDAANHLIINKQVSFNGKTFPIGMNLNSAATGFRNKLTAAVQTDSHGSAAGVTPPPCGMNIYDVMEGFLIA